MLQHLDDSVVGLYINKILKMKLLEKVEGMSFLCNWILFAEWGVELES